MIYAVIGGIILVLALYVVITWNTFVELKVRVEEAFATMDVYLKKRWDMVPNLVEIVKGYAEHEKETLSDIVELRNRTYDEINPEDKVEVNNKLAQDISKLLAIVEAYPELKANENYLSLSEELTQVEEDIANARKYYNGIVRDYNTKTQLFPSNFVASIFKFKTYNMFKIDENQRENVKVDMWWKSIIEEYY